MKIHPKDLRVDTFSAGIGAGHYGSITLTHVPSGIVIKGDFRAPGSQFRLRERLIKDLIEKLAAFRDLT